MFHPFSPSLLFSSFLSSLLFLFPFIRSLIYSPPLFFTSGSFLLGFSSIIHHSFFSCLLSHSIRIFPPFLHNYFHLPRVIFPLPFLKPPHSFTCIFSYPFSLLFVSRYVCVFSYSVIQPFYRHLLFSFHFLNFVFSLRFLALFVSPFSLSLICPSSSVVSSLFQHFFLFHFPFISSPHSK